MVNTRKGGAGQTALFSAALQLAVAIMLLLAGVQHAAAQGLVASYGLNEGTGTTTADLSGTGNNGTLTNTAWSPDGRVGNALSFNGSTSRVNIADSSSLDLRSMTLEAWVFPTALGSTRTVVYKERSGGLVYALFASNASGLPFASVRIGTTTISATGPSSLPLNTWSHLAATHDGATFRLYVNAVEVASQPASGQIAVSGAALRIGGNTRVAGQYFQGRIDEVRVFNQARTAAQIQADMTVAVDTVPPTITARSPASGATGVSPATTITATFSEAMASNTIDGTRFQLSNGSSTVPGSVTYNAATRVATLTPSAPLASGGYTATVRGGATGVMDVSGNPLATDSAWSFTVAANATTTAVSSSSNPSLFGQGVTFTATVTPVPPATGTPSGTVQFRIDGANFGSSVTLSGSPPSATSASTTTLTAGDHAVTAVYNGDASFGGSTSTALTQIVNAASGCTGNPIVVENCLPGNPATEWDVSGAGDSTIQGFTTDISVNRGQTISFKIASNAAYRLDIYRMGYYAGMGARRVTTISNLPSRAQPSCLNDSATGLIDCGNWTVAAQWPVPADATSGIYFAKAIRNDTGGASHIFFIVRDDASTSDLLFQTSDTTWQAYNDHGGNSLYTGNPAGRAYKVSYNRPFRTRGVDNAQDWVFNAEYPMVRWLEANGYDVSYFTGVDSDRRGQLILNHRVFLSIGHDEYWSGTQRSNVENARNNGVNLAFFSGNEIFWKTRWEASIDGSNTSHRTLVCYKETHANNVIDPSPSVWTGTWRDPRFSPPKDGGRPENALSGTIFMANDTGTNLAISVPEADGKMRFWRNTNIANLSSGQTTTLPSGTLGYEWDSDLDNGARPPGLFRLSTTTFPNFSQKLLDFGSTYGSGSVTHNLTLYKHSSGARVFGAGTIQWSWGLDANHDRGNNPPDVRMQQATVNLFADMGVQPGTLRPGLVAATASTDAAAPTSTITAPAAGANVPSGSTVTITGTATESGGGVVGGVEVSVDGGTTWHPATGRTNWSYAWSTPGSGASVTIKSRAVDDSGNLETPSAGVSVTVGSGSGTCPCSVLSGAAPSSLTADPDTAAVELGVKFSSSVQGFITAIRFYKLTAATGPFSVSLWTGAGALMASAQVTSTTSQGWQQVALPTPVPISANTTYVASYHTATGRYAVDENYFTNSVTAGPLTLLSNAQGGNGVFVYGAGGFPNQSFMASNYWVDVVLTTSGAADTTPPVVTDVLPADGATRVATGTTVQATFNEAMQASTINTSTFFLRDSSNNVVPASVSYNATTRTATLQPSASLSTSTTYTAVVKGGATDPRVKDQAGNAMPNDVSWSFATGGAPPTQGPGGPVLVITSSSNPFSTYYAEILRTEGLNLFQVASISSVTASTLAAHDVAILGEMPLTAGQVTMLSDWVQQGGRLIAMRPDKQLAALLGLTDAGATLSSAYLLIDTSKAPGSGLVSETIQFQGTADRYTLSGASSVATLYSDTTTATTAPAVTLRAVGSNGGQAAAFTYDLARSVIFSRQGNPSWSGQERDGVSPIRPDDLYFGAAAGDPQPDWVDLNKVAIPQADEQQRLLANLIISMNQARRPLPRFWYFPRGLPAVVIMTGDDHANGGTAGRFNQFIAQSPSGCSVDNWECIRGTSYVYVGTPLTDAQAAAYNAQGFEIGLHISTNCGNYTPTTLDDFYASQLSQWALSYPSLPAPVTNRTHCIAWSDYSTQPQVALQHGIRLDTNYYYWPPAWVNDRPGFFTGSGMPMRFAVNGAMIDVYQATSQMTDESGQTFPFTVDTLLDRARNLGYYGAFTANMHTDLVSSPGADAIVASAKARGIPVITARQMLQWLDGRNDSAFSALALSGNTLSFTIKVGAGARSLQAMVPVPSASQVSSITTDGTPVPFTTATIKGMKYAFIMAEAKTYQVTFAGDTTPPTVTSVFPPAGATAVSQDVTVQATFSEAMNQATVNSQTFELRDPSGTLVPGAVSYNEVAQRADLVPATPLNGLTAYTATVKGGSQGVKDASGIAMSADFTWSFTTGNPGAGCPCSLWSASTTPANLDSGDANAVELGVKFRSDVPGRVTAIRFYKGPNDTGSHVVNLWESNGTRLASVNVTGGTASGWQEVVLSSAVQISANTTYVASYHTTAGRYPFNAGYFASGVDNGLLHAPSSASVGGNGVYLYGAGGFPTNTFNATNYWVDVVFQP